MNFKKDVDSTDLVTERYLNLVNEIEAILNNCFSIVNDFPSRPQVLESFELTPSCELIVKLDFEKSRVSTEEFMRSRNYSYLVEFKKSFNKDFSEDLLNLGKTLGISTFIEKQDLPKFRSNLKARLVKTRRGSIIEEFKYFKLLINNI